MADIEIVRGYAQELMAEHGLIGWKLEITRSVGYAGQTDFGARTIALSGPHTQNHTETEVEDTILHEIAHALVGYQAAHGPKWQAMARKLGATPKAHMTIEGPSLRETLAPWVGRCSAGHESPYRFFRKPKKRYGCRQCSPVWKPEHVLTYTKEEV